MAGARIQVKRGTASSWASNNPVLFAGEIGFETDTKKVKVGDGTTAWNSLSYTVVPIALASLNDLGDVTIVSASNGDFLRWNGTAWINDAVNLSTDTVGNYMVDVAGGTGVTVTHTPGEGSTASVAIGQDVATTASVTFAHVSASVTGNVSGNLTGNVTGNADTASALQNARTIELVGNLSGSASFDGSTNIQISASVQPNAVILGQDTAGDYMANIVAGTGVTVNHTQAEGSTASVSIGQDVGTSASVTFANVNVSNDLTVSNDLIVTGDLTVNGTTTTLNTQDLLVEDNTIVLNANVTGNPSGTAGIEIERGNLTNVQLRWNETTDSWEITEDGTTYRNIAAGQDVETSSSVTFAYVYADVAGDLTGNADTATTLATARAISLAGDLSGSASFDGSQNITITAQVEPNSVALGTDTTGNYMSGITAGQGITISHTPGEGSTASVETVQDIGQSASPSFAAVSASAFVGNASTATTLQNARTISLGGDLSGSASFNGSSNITITAAVEPNSVALGTDTTGNYMSDVVAGTGISVTHTPGEGSSASVALNAWLNDLGDVVITGSPERFQTLGYDGAGWVNSYAPVVSYVRNAEATTLTAGTVVYLFGGTGDHASVKRADNNSDTTSSKTVGVVTASIAAGQNGSVITRGYASGMDLSAYNTGDILWLNTNGQVTTTKPTAPKHMVFIGVVVRATNNGIMYVAVQNGYELAELHDVKVNGTTDGQFLRYNSASSVWIADTINLGTDTAGDYVQNLVAGTGVTLSNNSGEGSTPTVAIGQDVGTSASVVFYNLETTHDLTVGRNLYVSGSVVTENQTSLQIDDPFIYLNGSSSVTNVDLGIAGNYNDGTYRHAGIFRDATDGKFKFFDSYEPEPSSPIDTGHASYSPAPVVAETFESTIATGTAPFTVASTTEVANLHADTASSLHTARAISLSGDLSGSVSFDGSGDVVLTASVEPNSVALGTDTTGNYMVDLAEGTGVTIVHTPGEGSTASVSIGQSVATSASVTFAHVSAPITGNVTGNVTGDVSGNAGTATTLQTSRTISLGGDLSGSASFNGGSDITITAAVQPNSVALGTDTTGNYMSDLTQGTGVTITHTPGEGSNATIAIGQDVSTSSSVTFAAVTAPLVGNASTATTLQNARAISLGGDLSGSASFDGSTDITITAAVQPNSVALGTDTTGNYVSDVTAGTGVTVTHTPGEGSSPTIAIGQAVGTSASVQFAQITTTGNVTIGGDLTVNGTTTTVNTETINLADNIIVLNSNETSAPSQNAGIEVERGSSANVSIRWNETSDKWELTEDGTAYQDIATVGYVDAQSITALDDIGDVTLTSASAGDFLKWNGTAWVNDLINLGTDTTGNYMADVVAGTGITVTHTAGEGSSASVALNATLDNLSNVTVPSPTDGDILTYSSASSAWIAQAGGGGASTLDDLTDAIVAGPSNNQVLIYKDSAGVSGAWTNSKIYLDDLGDVSVSPQNVGEVLIYGDGAWVNELPASFASRFNLDDIGNVNASTPSNGDFLTYDTATTSWIPKTVVSDRDILVRFYMEVI